MSAKNAVKANPELVLTRTFKAPRKLVFQAWTDPQQLAQWWGPNGFTCPRCEVDMRAGGAIRIDMQGPDGMVYPMTGTFVEIVDAERIVFTSGALGEDGKPLFEVHNTITFEDAPAGQTLLTLHARATVLHPLATRHLEGQEAGWKQSLDRLGIRVSGGPTTVDREILAERTFNAPRDLVFQMWTEPQHVQHWWGPRGFSTTIHQMDVRPGGTWKLTMHGPDGTDYPNEKTYAEIDRPRRLVFDHTSDPRHRMTVDFLERGQQTQVVVQLLFETAALRDQVAQKYGAVEGLKQNLEKLEEYLVTRSGANGS